MINNYNSSGWRKTTHPETQLGKVTGSPPTLFNKVKFSWLFVLIFSFLLLGNYATAQTTLIDPAAGGGFESGATFAANGWTASNSANNPWFVGTPGGGTPMAGNKAFVSNDGGITNSYNPGTNALNYFYRDITVPAGESKIVLTFNWLNNGETTWDVLQVYTCPTTTTPTGVAAHPGSGLLSVPTALTGATCYFGGTLVTTTQTQTISLPASLAGTTFRLVFSWKNEPSGSQPPASIDNISLTSATPVPLSGVYTIDNTLANNPIGIQNFSSIANAVSYLNTDGISGAVTFNVAAGQTFSGDVPALTTTGTSVNTITFQKSGTGANPIIAAVGTTGTIDAGFTLSGADYVTIDGINIVPSTANVEYGFLIRAASATNGAQFNTIKNTSINLGTRAGFNTSYGIFQTASTTGGGVTPTAAGGTNSNNKYYNLTITGTRNDGVILAGNATNRDVNSEVGTTSCNIRNSISNLGPTVSTFTGLNGMTVTNQENHKIFNNDVFNVAGNQSATTGINIITSYGTSDVYNNKISGISTFGSTTGTTVATGLRAGNATNAVAHNLRVYNNTVSTLNTALTTASATRVLIGIFATGGSSVSTLNIDNNTVSIGNGVNAALSSSCFEIGSATPILSVRNNIFANFSPTGTTSRHYAARFTNATWGASSSVLNNNNYYIANDLGTSGFISQVNTTNNNSLTAHQTALTSPGSQDVASQVLDPVFNNNNTDLSTSVVAFNSAGINLAWVTSDVNCATRPLGGANNDLGAIEFNGTCLTPTLAATTAITDVSATVNWNATTPAPATGYEYEVRSAGLPGSGGATASGATTTLTANVTGLTPTTNYKLYVRSDCGSGTFSTWSSAGNFNTQDPFCTGTPTAGTVTQASLSGCATSVLGPLTLTGSSAGVGGLIYQWEQSTDGISGWTNASGASATTNSFTPSTATAGTLYYRAVVTCSVGGAFATTSNSTVVTVVNCDYNVTRTTGITYSSIGATGTGLTGFTTLDDATSTAVNIGFPFFYKGTTFTQFSANTNGLLSLGSTTTTNYTSGLSSTEYNKIAPFWDDLYVTGGVVANIPNFIKYKLDGTTPNQVLTVEWIGMEQFGNAGPNINFQVKLYETSNKIEIVHGQMQIFDGSTGTGNAYSYSVGISGPNGSTGSLKTLALLGENSNTFGTTDAISLSIPPACNVSYSFDTAAAYTGATTFAYAIPANDEPAGAFALPVNTTPCIDLCGTYYNSNLATASTAQASTCTVAPDDDVWFSFVAPTSGAALNISVKSASGYDAIVSITDASFADVGTFGCTNTFGNAFSESLNPTGLTPGATYYVRVSNNGVGNGNKSGFSICVSEIPAAPTNDNPCGAVVLTPATACAPYADNTALSGSTASTTCVISATTTTSNAVVIPTQTGAQANVNDVWFKFTATSDYHGITVTPVPGFDVAVQAYGIDAGTSCPTTLTLTSQGTVNGGGSGTTENIQFSTTVGTEYYLRVFRHATGFAGTPVNGSQFSICIFNPAPACVVNTSPANAATAVSATPTLTWPTTAFASNYDLYFGSTSGPTTLLTTVPSTLGALSYSYTLTPAQTLNELSTYYWYVTPRNIVGGASCGVANETSFTTAVIPVVVTSFAPNTVCNGASDAERTTVITGSGFAGATAVTINGVAVQSFVVDSNSQITAVVASTNTSGTVNVTKPTANGTSTATFTVNPTPIVAAIAGPSNAMCTATNMVLTNSTVGGIWTTSNAAVATVSGGNVTAITAGTVTITYTVTVDGCTDFKTYPITVNETVVVTTQPISQTIVTGSPVTFSVAATGTGVTYQWEFDDNVNGFQPLSGETGASYSIAATIVELNGYLYRCVVSGTAPCNAVNSNFATLTVGNTGIGTQPSNQTICGDGSVTYNVVATGDIVSYQWYKNDILGEIALVDAAGSIAGANSASLTLSGLTTANNGESYFVVVTGNANDAISNSATLTVNESATIAVTSTNNSACYSGATVNFVATATGTFSAYVWEYSTDNFATAPTAVTNGVPVGATYAGLGTANLAVTTTLATPTSGMNYYRCSLTAAAPCVNVSSLGTLLNFNTPAVTVGASANLICNPGGTAVTLTAAGASTYSWSPATGLSATTGDVVTANPTTTTTYTVTGTDASGCAKTASTTIVVGGAVTATATATPAVVCPGVDSQLVAITPVVALTPDFYTFAASAGTYTPITGGTNSSATGDDGTQNTISIGFPFTYGGTSFTTFSISTNGTIRLGATATSFTNGLATNTNVIAPLWDDNNRTTGAISYLVSGTSPNRVLTVQWSNIAIGGGGSTTSPTNNFQTQLFEGSNVVKFNYGTLDDTNGISASIGISGAAGKYRSVTPLSPVASSTSSETTENNAIDSVANIPTGTSYTFTPPVVPTYTYAWSPTTFLAPGQETLRNPVATAVTSDVTYTVVVTSNLGCSTTATTAVTVQSGVTVATQPVASTICQTQTATFSVVASGPSIAYQWRKDGVNLATPASATTATLTLLNTTPANNGLYDVVMTPVCGSAVTSDAVALLVKPAPTAAAITAQTFCAGTTTSPFVLTGTPSGVTFNISGGASVGLANQTGVTEIPAFTVLASSATVTVTPVFDGCLGTVSTFVLTGVDDPSTLAVTPASPQVCSVGNPTLLTARFVNAPQVAGCLTGSLGLFPGTSSTATTCDGTTSTVIATNSWAGEYSEINVNANTKYVFSSSIATDYITIASEDNNAILASGPSPLTWYSGSAAGIVRNYIYTNASCGEEQSSRAKSYTCLPVTGVVWSPAAGLFTNFAGTTPYIAGTSSFVVYAKPTATTLYTASKVVGACTKTVDVTVALSTATTWYADADADTFGNPAVSQLSCAQPVGYVANSLDCLDTNANVNPSRVEIAYNGIDDNCDGNFDEGFPPLTTNVPSAQCNTTLQYMHSSVYANRVVGGTAARYRFKNLTTNAVQTIVKTGATIYHWLQFNTLASYDYATSYEVDVELQVNGVWLGYYGSTCIINSPGYNAVTPIGVSSLSGANCGKTLAEFNEVITASNVSGATGYRFELTNQSTGVLLGTIDRTLPWFNLTMLTNKAVFQTPYEVRVAVKTTGAYGAYGAMCIVNTPTVLGTYNCGITATSRTTAIHAFARTGVTVYRFKVTNLTTNAFQVVDRTLNWFNFALLSSIYQPNTSYSVEVAYSTNPTTGTLVFSDYSASCNVATGSVVTAQNTSTTPVVASKGAKNDDNFAEFKVVAFPNPFTNNFALDLKSSADDKVGIKIYDMIGKLIESRDVEMMDMSNVSIGDNYPAGVYSIIVNQAENVKTLRVIKR